MKSTSQMWDIWSPHQGLMGYVQPRKVASIAMFACNVDRAVWPAGSQGLPLFRDHLKEPERKAWARLYGRGFRAVPVNVSIPQFRIPQ